MSRPWTLWCCPKCKQESYKQLTKEGTPYTSCSMCPPVPRKPKPPKGHGNSDKGLDD